MMFSYEIVFTFYIKMRMIYDEFYFSYSVIMQIFIFLIKQRVSDCTILLSKTFNQVGL